MHSKGCEETSIAQGEALKKASIEAKAFKLNMCVKKMIDWKGHAGYKYTREIQRLNN
jgi:hypothetical protein